MGFRVHGLLVLEVLLVACGLKSCWALVGVQGSQSVTAIRIQLVLREVSFPRVLQATG